ncbi:enoyl-CoA hydratase/isomerase family protein [Aureimonas glaciei]|jgi:enoyl-CoA hydratase/carnithine racemase|uniref:Enoyl-CoA hydratase n=1 Tax=Aureimonas glaciei TaxID=1776957 RepID=A0A916YFC2_9HYPH|nr:enoyl-CoA hydratase-related protein [Aureimonas glaciei]GGD42675.1 enoyl-CoA hydratase [Aureimonas glaciei]
MTSAGRPGDVMLVVADGVATVRIHNPPLNILTIAVREKLFAVVGEIERRQDVRVVVFEGEGRRAFSVGSDIGEFPRTELGGVAKIRFEQYLLDRIENLPQVTIAKMSGMALGGGAELALACDFRLLDLKGSLGFPEISLGALPAAGGMKRLAREIGSARARQLVLLGRPLDAPTAASWGLVTAAVPSDDLDDATRQLAQSLCRLPREALALAKKTIAASSPGGEMDTREAEAFGRLFRSLDLAEGLAAFIEKRPPAFA